MPRGISKKCQNWKSCTNVIFVIQILVMNKVWNYTDVISEANVYFQWQNMSADPFLRRWSLGDAYEHSTCMYYGHSTCMYYDHSTCMYYDYSTCMITVHAGTMITVHACTMIIVDTCPMIIIYACTMIIVYTCTFCIVRTSFAAR